jgi:hypothetical protein
VNFRSARKTEFFNRIGQEQTHAIDRHRPK